MITYAIQETPRAQRRWLWLLALAALIGIAWVLATPGRWEAALRALGTIAQPFGEVVSTACVKQQEGLREVNRSMFQLASTTLDGAIARSLARAREPLLTRHLRERIGEALPDWRAPTIATVKTALREHPAFRPVGKYRWQLGASYGPVVS